MIRHIALWTLTEAAHKEGLDAVIEKLNKSAQMMLGQIPGLIHVEIARNLDTDSAHNVALYSELESEEALKVYQTHPAHLAHKERAKDYISNREIIDFYKQRAREM
jgi:heme-degrading monooxygenase HmoA